jgi:hypothetical protein
MCSIAVPSLATTGYILDASSAPEFEHTNTTKIWYAHAHWWCIAQDTSADDWFIYKHDGSIPSTAGTEGGWSKTAANVDSRSTSQIDLWFGPAEDRLHVLRMHGTGGTYNEYVWNPTFGTYEKDEGLGDVLLPSVSKEACIAVDSTGQAFVAYESSGDLVIAYSTGPSRGAWSSYDVTTGVVSGADNRAALTPFNGGSAGGRMGLMYFSTPTRLTFRVHDDDAGDGPGAWTTETVDAETTADDHVCLRSHSATGDVFAVVKDTQDNVIFYRRTPGGTWGDETVLASGSEEATRPQVCVDEANDEVYTFWTDWTDDTIVYRKSAIGPIAFGAETEAIGDPGEVLDNVQLAKHGVDGTTDMLVTAATSTDTWYNVLSLTGSAGTTWYRDADGDGFGTPDDTTVAETRPSGYVADDTDCDDTDPDIYPGAPQICDGNNNDCNDPYWPGVGAVCGNGVCEAGNGEDCVGCPADCDGTQNGKPGSRYCCGDGGGQNPVSCSDPRCGASCTEVPVTPSCCGDLFCDAGESHATCPIDCPAPYCGDSVCNGGEDRCDCPGDCGAPPSSEAGRCSDGIDNDCDGPVDAADADCPTCAPKHASCSDDSACCSGKCKRGRCR